MPTTLGIGSWMTGLPAGTTTTTTTSRPELEPERRTGVRPGMAWGGNSAGVGTTKDETFIEGTNINLGSNCASYAQLGETRGNETSAGSPQPLSSTQVPA
ncbi:hypothetical protein FOYG_09555 [Fusarium oxysporum NRRL 32931]|uniref:Uncharacterized protein n=1 Tax=Fusarium oxysporum NRRL 32931 TaxID=660029 RepID=W9I4T8_FUSOX|nr:hypothetical protein FOYG_09555 [Fusarium oxysporum NRRL 32931]